MRQFKPCWHLFSISTRPLKILKITEKSKTVSQKKSLERIPTSRFSYTSKINRFFNPISPSFPRGRSWPIRFGTHSRIPALNLVYPENRSTSPSLSHSRISSLISLAHNYSIKVRCARHGAHNLVSARRESLRIIPGRRKARLQRDFT